MMKNGPLFFLGLFVALVLSWAGVVLGSNAQLGSLVPHFDENENKAFPERLSGLAARGQWVYADLGCAACHTQQTRRPDFGADQARGWGERQSYARDYIYQPRVQLGQMRIGPDLANFAARKVPYDADDLSALLYTGIVPLAKEATHPTYRFLFEDKKIVGQRSDEALKLPSRFAPGPGREIVATKRAQVLISYLLSLNNSYAYPEETAANTVKTEKEGAHAATEKAHDEKAPAPAKPTEPSPK
jgi:cytochrome c oxidase cbb3-type subunit 2